MSSTAYLVIHSPIFPWIDILCDGEHLANMFLNEVKKFPVSLGEHIFTILFGGETLDNIYMDIKESGRTYVLPLNKFQFDSGLNLGEH